MKARIRVSDQNSKMHSMGCSFSDQPSPLPSACSPPPTWRENKMRNLRSRFLEHGAGDVWQDIRHAQVQDKLAAAGQLAVPDIERQQGPHPHQNLQTGQGSAPGVGNNLNRRKQTHQKKVTFEWIYHTFHDNTFIIFLSLVQVRSFRDQMQILQRIFSMGCSD